MSLRMIKRGLAVVVLVATVFACGKGGVYSHYVHTSVEGWHQSDTLTFSLGPVAEGGAYEPTIGLRINSSYPFTALTLILKSEIFHQDNGAANPINEGSTTVNFSLTDSDGNIRGSGTNIYQYSFPLKSLLLEKGDSMALHVYHIMKRNPLPGITDVGVTLTATH